MPSYCRRLSAVAYFASYIFLFSLGIAAWRYDWLRQLEWKHTRDWITALVIASSGDYSTSS